MKHLLHFTFSLLTVLIALSSCADKDSQEQYQIENENLSLSEVREIYENYKQLITSSHPELSDLLRAGQFLKNDSDDEGYLSHMNDIEEMVNEKENYLYSILQSEGSLEDLTAFENFGEEYIRMGGSNLESVHYACSKVQSIIVRSFIIMTAAIHDVCFPVTTRLTAQDICVGQLKREIIKFCRVDEVVLEAALDSVGTPAEIPMALIAIGIDSYTIMLAMNKYEECKNSF